MSNTKAMRKAAEQEYTITAFDYVRDPVGSASWVVYWKAWQAATEQATAAERERCAKVCESLVIDDYANLPTQDDCAEAIRKGEALEGGQ